MNNHQYNSNILDILANRIFAKNSHYQDPEYI